MLEAEPVAASGTAWLDPDGAGGDAPFQAYCDMTTDFGGWTLLGSFTSDDFDAGYRGLTDDPCYETACVNRAYSTVLLASDIRIDAADAPIAAEGWELSLFSRQVHESLLSRTLQQVFEASTPAFVEAPGGTVVTSFQNGRTCNTGWGEFSNAACLDTAVLVFRDPSSCDDTITFALGVAPDYAALASNCDGWPQNPGLNFPRNLRFWSR